MPGSFSEACQARNVIPKPDDPDLQAFFSQVIAEGFDLSTFSGAIDAGKTYELSAMVALVSGHIHTPRVQ
jgi:hypothetical protein